MSDPSPPASGVLNPGLAPTPDDRPTGKVATPASVTGGTSTSPMTSMMRHFMEHASALASGQSDPYDGGSDREFSAWVVAATTANLYAVYKRLQRTGRLSFLGELENIVDARRPQHESEDDPEGYLDFLKGYMVHIYQAYIPELMPLYPHPRNRGDCGANGIWSSYDIPEGYYLPEFVTLPDAQHYGESLVSPGSVIKVSYDNARWSHPVGYCKSVVASTDPATIVKDFYDACQSAADNAEDSSADSSTLSAEDIAAADAAAAEARTAAAALAAADEPGWLRGKVEDRFNARNEDGQRAVTAGGVADFVTNFWGSATEDTHEGAEWGASQEDKDAARASKPSNK